MLNCITSIIKIYFAAFDDYTRISLFAFVSFKIYAYFILNVVYISLTMEREREREREKIFLYLFKAFIKF